MTETGIASRYAHALVEALTDPGPVLHPGAADSQRPDPQAALLSFDDFVQTVADSHDLDEVLLSPLVPAARKRDVLRAIADRMGLHRLVTNFLFLLIDHRRLALVHEISHLAAVFLDEKLGFVRASVSSAFELSDEERRQICEKLEQITGKRVRIVSTVDPELIGGVVARVGSSVYDGSIRAQLAILGERLATV